MNNYLNQPGGATNKGPNKAAIARIFGIKDNEVTYLDKRLPIDGYKILFDPSTQMCFWSNGGGVPSSWTVNGSVLTLTTSTGSYTCNIANNISSRTVNSFAELRTITPDYEGQEITLLSYNSGGSLGGGTFTGHLSNGVDDGGVTATSSSSAGYYWVRNLKDFLSFDMFGVTGDGTTDDTANFLIAANAANNLKMKMVALTNARFLLSGGTAITFNYSVDFNYSTIDISTYWGQMIFTRANENLPVTYTTTDNAVTSLVSDGTLLKGIYWPGWNGVSEIEDKYVEITTSVNYYNYRGTVYTRTERNRSLRYGAVESSLPYTLDPKTITGVNAYPIPEKTVIENLNVYSSAGPWNGIIITHTNALVQNIEFSCPDTILTKGFLWMHIISSFGCTFKNITAPWGNHLLAPTGAANSKDATYVWMMEECHDITFEGLWATGTEWGVFGTHESSNITLKDSTINRYDSHRPFQGFLKFINCTIQNTSIHAQGIGDIIIDNCDFINNSINYLDTGSTWLIDTRGDAGGFVDGNLTIRNTRIKNLIEAKVFLIQGTYVSAIGTDAITMPSGTPITRRLFKTVSISGLTVETLDNTTSIMDLGFTIQNAVISGPKEYNITDVTGDAVSITFPLNYTPAETVTISSTDILVDKFNFIANVSNVTVEPTTGIFITDQATVSTRNINALINLDRITPMVDGAPPAVFVHLGGIVNINNSIIGKTYTNGTSAGYSNSPLQININDSTILTDTPFDYTPLAIIQVNVNDSTFIGSTKKVLSNAFLATKLNNVRGVVTGSGFSEIYLGDDIGAVTATLTPYIKISQYTNKNCKLICNNGIFNFVMPAPGSTYFVSTGFDATNQAICGVSIFVNNAGTAIALTVIGSATPRYIAVN